MEQSGVSSLHCQCFTDKDVTHRQDDCIPELSCSFVGGFGLGIALHKRHKCVMQHGSEDGLSQLGRTVGPQVVLKTSHVEMPHGNAKGTSLILQRDTGNLSDWPLRDVAVQIQVYFSNHFTNLNIAHSL